MDRDAEFLGLVQKKFWFRSFDIDIVRCVRDLQIEDVLRHRQSTNLYTTYYIGVVKMTRTTTDCSCTFLSLGGSVKNSKLRSTTNELAAQL